MKVRGWIIFSGFVWFCIGAMLLSKGLRLIAADLSGEKNATLYVALGLIAGFLKGRFVLSKTVRRVVLRIVSLPLPIRLKDVYAPSYYFIILGMMGLGMLFRFLPISADVRGTVDIAIGSALINGAMLYFRAARSYDKSFPSQSPELDRAVPPKSAESSDV